MTRDKSKTDVHIYSTFYEEYPHLIKSYSVPDHPPPPPFKPMVLSPNWFRSFNSTPSRPMLPPALQFGFPYNIVRFRQPQFPNNQLKPSFQIFLLGLPILIPTFMGLVLIRFSLASRSSRRRIKDLESDESYVHKLVHVFAQLEKDMGDVVVDLIDETDSAPPSTVTRSSSVAAPVLKDVQKTMAKLLNGIPGLRKERAFFDNVRNSHAILISRDPKFKLHALGQGILRHWVDNFEF